MRVYLVCCCMYGYKYHLYVANMDQPGKVDNAARGQAGEKRFSVSPFAPDSLASRDRFGRTIPRYPAHFPHPD